MIDAILASRHQYITREEFEKKGELGTLVHQACALDAVDDLDRESVDPEVHSYLQAWWRFRSETRAKIIASNILVYHDLYDYAGEIDHEIVMPNGEHGIIDVKSGVQEPKHFVQLAAYKAAYHPGGPQWLLYLRPSGDYRLLPTQPHQEHFHVFLAALRCYRWKESMYGK